MYTQHELTNIELNKQEQIFSIVGSATMLVKILKPFDFGEYNKGLKMAEEAIVRAYCTIHMAHMDESDFEEMLTNTLAYFATGLHDTDKLSISSIADFAFELRAWRYTPEMHNNAGLWFEIYTFQKNHDAFKCGKMLKDIGAELEKLHNN
jgi:nucleoid DNA-binding protein